MNRNIKIHERLRAIITKYPMGEGGGIILVKKKVKYVLFDCQLLTLIR